MVRLASNGGALLLGVIWVGLAVPQIFSFVGFIGTYLY